VRYPIRALALVATAAAATLLSVGAAAAEPVSQPTDIFSQLHGITAGLVDFDPACAFGSVSGSACGSYD
jgi:ammonia channel protein AmtB